MFRFREANHFELADSFFLKKKIVVRKETREEKRREEKRSFNAPKIVWQW